VPSLLLDGEKMRHVLLHILQYALQQVPSGGRVRVETRTGTGHVQAEIAHDGPKVAGEVLDRLFVPFSMEQIYARRAAANGANALLVTRAIRDINHCGFNTTEMERGFADLVNWVSNSVKPAGDDILTPAVVANPNFGCNFTVGAHALAPACQ